MWRDWIRLTPTMLSGEARSMTKEVAKSSAVVVGQQCGAIAPELSISLFLIHLAKHLHYGLSWLGHNTWRNKYIHLRLLSFPPSQALPQFFSWSHSWSVFDVGFICIHIIEVGLWRTGRPHSDLPSGPCTSLNIGVSHPLPLGNTNAAQCSGDTCQRSICLAGQQMGSVNHTWGQGVLVRVSDIE